MISRRRFLASTALAGAGVAAFARGAAAFSIEAPARADADSLADARACTTEAYHDRVLAEVRAALDGKPLSDAQRRRLMEVVSCPLCGCPVSRF